MMSHGICCQAEAPGPGGEETTELMMRLSCAHTSCLTWLLLAATVGVRRRDGWGRPLLDSLRGAREPSMLPSTPAAVVGLQLCANPLLVGEHLVVPSVW